MTGPTSPTCARPSGSSSRKHFLNHALARSEELADFRRVFATGFREVGASAAAATDDGCELFHNLSRRDLLDQIWFNTEAWIVRHQTYKRPVLGPYYKYSALFIESIVY